MQLDEFIKSKCKWHLGYNQTSIPAGDLARIEEALIMFRILSGSVK